MTLEQGFMWFSLLLLCGAYWVNQEGIRLLDEAKREADRWGAERERAEELNEEARTLFENAQRLRGFRS